MEILIETNFSDKLLLTDTQVSTIFNTFTNGSSANIKFSKTQLSKMIQSGRILPSFLFSGDSAKKTIDGVSLLIKSVLKESMNMDAKKLEDKIVEGGLSFLGKKLKKRNFIN